MPVWRTSDDTDYEGDDQFHYEIVYDNLHCSRQNNETAGWYSSLGCVVVAGKPGDSGARSITSELGPWKKFLRNAYALDQSRFALAIFDENEAMRTAEVGPAGRSPTVRFGSRGVLVVRLQEALLAKNYDIGSSHADGIFEAGTARGLRDFQRDTFGKNGTDLIAGPTTAEALGIEWPRSGLDTLADAASTRMTAMASDMVAVAADDVDIILSRHAGEDAAEDEALDEDPSLKIELDVTKKPLQNWAVKKQGGNNRWDVVIDGQPVYLGKFLEYTGYGDLATRGPTRGLARTSGANPKVLFEPGDWTEFGYWPELIYPTAYAESNGCFTVINAWDRAAMTFGFIQLAAHTGDDFLPFFRLLFEKLPQEARQWFPELDVINGKLCFVKGSRYRNLEVLAPAHDGGFTKSYYHGDLMAFFNPDRYHGNDLRPDTEELHASARWLAWTMKSPAMRRLQVEASIGNMKSSLIKLHGKIRSHPQVKLKYPNGVDGMRCDILSVAIAVPHLGEGHIPVVLRALLTTDPIGYIEQSNYGVPGRSRNTVIGLNKRPKLQQLVYDFASHKPV